MATVGTGDSFARPGDILKTALDWREEGRDVALATVVSTWGSSPRPVGSHLVIDDNGSFEGSVSGGCVEGAVIRAATEVIKTGARQLLSFGVTDDEAWKVGLACGGQIEVLVVRVE